MEGNRREHYRIRYPLRERARFVFGTTISEVIECSERGLRFRRTPDTLGEGTRINGRIAMRHGKDVMLDKPGITTLTQLAEVKKVQAETKRICCSVRGSRGSSAPPRSFIACWAEAKSAEPMTSRPRGSPKPIPARAM